MSHWLEGKWPQIPVPTEASFTWVESAARLGEITSAPARRVPAHRRFGVQLAEWPVLPRARYGGLPGRRFLRSPRCANRHKSSTPFYVGNISLLPPHQERKQPRAEQP